MVKVNCLMCNKKNEVYLSNIKRNKGKFCNKKCQGKWKTKNLSGKNSPLWLPRIKVKCKQCKKEIVVELSEKNKAKFCSIKCCQKFFRNSGKNHPLWKEKIKRICNQCGKKFEVFPSDIKREKCRCCSPKCNGKWMSKNMVGKNAPNWMGGISFEPYSVDWRKTLKQNIRERDRYVCQLCGKPQGDKELCVHHIDYDKKNCNPDNLITLCDKCHPQTNSKRNYWLKYFCYINSRKGA